MREEAHGLATPVNCSPGQALSAVMRLASGQMLYASYKVSQLEEHELFVDGDRKDSGAYEQIPHVWVAFQREAMRDVARYAKMAADAGIAERQTNLQEEQTAMIARVMEATLDELGLNKKQKEAVGPALRKHLTLASVAGERV